MRKYKHKKKLYSHACHKCGISKYECNSNQVQSLMSSAKRKGWRVNQVKCKPVFTCPDCLRLEKKEVENVY